MPPIDTRGAKIKRGRPKARVRAKPKSKPYTLPKSHKPANAVPERKAPARPKAKPYKLPRTFKPANTVPQTKAQTRAAEKTVRTVTRRVERKKADEAKQVRRGKRAFGEPKAPTFGMARARLERIKREANKEYEREHRDRDTKIGPFNLEAELEGRGGLQKVASAVKKVVDKANEAVPDVLQGTPGGNSLPPDVARAGAGGSEIGKEVVDLLANAPSSMYMAGAAAKEAAQGDTKRGKKLWKDYKETSAIPAAIKGDWKEAAERAEKAPIATALELWGGKAVVGRAGGAAARKAPLPKGKVKDAVRKAGSTKRENLRLQPGARRGEGPEIERRYSKDIIDKAAQKVGERVQRKRGKDPAADRGTHVSLSLPPRMGGAGTAGIGGPAARPKLVRRVDTRVHSQDMVSRERKAKADRDTRKITRVPVAESRVGRVAKNVRSPRRAARERAALAAGIQLVAEGTARASRVRRDLRVRLGELARAHKSLTDPERKRLNRQEAKHIRELLNLSDAQLKRVVDASQAFAKQQEPVQARGVKAGVFDERGRSKRFFPALQTHVRRPAGEKRTPLTPDEIKVAAKVAARRHRRGKSLPPKLAAAARAAERRFLDENPGATLPRRTKIGEKKAVKRADFAEALTGVRRRQHVPPRRLDPDELVTAARVLQRRERRGKSTLAGLPEGGPAFVTQRPGPGRVGARLRPNAPFEPTKKRGGRAFEEGSRDVGRAALLRQAVESEATVTAAEGFQLLDREFGRAAGKDGKRYADSRDEAAARARELTLDPDTGQLKKDAVPLVPVNIAQFQTFGARLKAKQAEGMPRSYAGIADMERQAAKEAWDAATQESGRGKWVLMPEPVVQRLRAHADVGTHGPAHALSNQFKDVVLTTSGPAGWIAANAADLGTRTVMAGITPLDIVRGRMVARKAGEKGLQGEHAAVSTTGGGLFHAADALNKGARPAGYLENPARTIVAAPWRAWKGGVYALEHTIEKLPQWGAVGKAMRQDTPRARADAAMKRDLKTLLKLHDEQIDAFATKLATDRAHEARIQKLTEDVVGRWGKVSPTMRRALLIAPFAQWLGAATRYALVTLPTQHPIKTGIIAGVHQMTEDERMKLGLSHKLPRDRQAQDYQMGTLPIKVGKNKYGPTVKGIPTKRLTSLGTAADAAGFANLRGFLMPQFSSALDAGFGVSWTGEPLVYPEWWPDKKLRGLPLPPDVRNKVALGALIENITPFASAYRRGVLGKGRPQEPYSTILTPATRKKWNAEDEKFIEYPGTRVGGILEWLNPVPKQQQVYTLGAVKQIEDNRTTSETLKRWNAQRQRRRQTADPLAGWDGDPTGENAPEVEDPLAGWDGDPKPKKRKPKGLPAEKSDDPLAGW